MKCKNNKKVLNDKICDNIKYLTNISKKPNNLALIKIKETTKILTKNVNQLLMSIKYEETNNKEKNRQKTYPS